MVIEDEKKFQEYFLKEKNKIARMVNLSPVSKNFELSVNKEIIEDNQEKIIEKEESVPSPQIPLQKYSKVEKTRRTKFKNGNKLFAYTKNIFYGWYKNAPKPIGLKGGADSTKNYFER